MMVIIFVEPEETDQTVQMRRLRQSLAGGAVHNKTPPTIKAGGGLDIKKPLSCESQCRSA